MKVVKASSMAYAESLAYKEGIDPEDYMLNAAKGIFEYLIDLISNKKLPSKIIFFAGKGNNAADGFIVCRYLLEKGYQIKIYELFDSSLASKLCKKQRKKIVEKSSDIVYLKNIKDLILDEKSFILDGIFGTGFKGEIDKDLKSIIKKINQSNLKKISIDIPSGVNGDTGEVKTLAIKADITIYLGLAKLGFFINDGPKFIGKLKYVDFGLSKKYEKLAKKELDFMENTDLKKLLPKIDKKRHKYEAGFVVGISGSSGMFGAAKLASLASLRAGAGIVKVITEKEIPNAFNELVNVIIDFNSSKDILDLCNKSDAVFIGPGLGRGEKQEKLLLEILPKLKKKTCLDADGLYHLANNQYTLLCHDTVLTPHKKEMLRLLKQENLEDLELIEKTSIYSKERKVIIVLKGFPTIIFHPQKDPLTILGGDPGLATAGTGDVLTGMITSFAAQGLDLYDACILAVNIHFLAGEKAAYDKTSFSLIASDVIDYLPKVFREIISS